MKRSFKTLIILFLSLLCFFGVNAQEIITGKVIKVSDGDTFRLLTQENRQYRIRVYGIDAPESSQAYGQKSKETLSNMIAGETVSINVVSKDKYGRLIAKIQTKDIPDISLVMIQKGMAWHYSHFDNTTAYANAQESAQKNHIGLWVQKNPVNPYIYRKENKKNK